MSILPERTLSIITILAIIALSCSTNSPDTIMDGDDSLDDSTSDWVYVYSTLPIRSNPRPQTTESVPHVQIGVELVPEVHDEMVRKVYAIPGVEDLPSVIGSWRGLSLSEDVTIRINDAVLGDRELGHIHHDGSLHIFLEPSRADQAVDSGWAVHHPYAIQGQIGWDGFVMLYTPQSLEELDVTFQLIVDAYNYVTAQNYQPSN